LGFKSVYHITDLPSFISEDQYVVIDPHKRYLKDENQNATLGLRHNFVSSKYFKDLYPNQLKRFKVFNNTNTESFRGTIFCFPLRTKEQANCSKISSSIHTEEHIDEWFEKIKHDSLHLLLFLKSVTQVTLYKRVNGGELLEIFSVTKTADFDHQRLLIPNLIQRLFTPKQQKGVEVEYFSQEKFSDDHSSHYVATIVMNDFAKKLSKEKKFLITQYLDDQDAYEFSRSPRVRKYSMKLLPWTGIAIPLFDYAGDDADEDNNNNNIEEAKKLFGKSFCFLPLPINTGLPCLLHGFFSVSSNRRDLWKGEDLAGDDSKDGMKVRWNELLLKHCLPINYLLAISYLKDYYLNLPDNININNNLNNNNNNNNNSNNINNNNQVAKRMQLIAERIYRHLPRRVSNDFQPLVDGFYQRLINRSILTSGYLNYGQEWVFPEDVILLTDDNINEYSKIVFRC
jgi:sacsin